LRVLVVDDNHFQLRVVKASLKKSGIELDTAVHGKEAVDFVERRIALGSDAKLYDVILMDSMMPVMDGATATSKIRVLERAFRAELRSELTMAGGLHEREMVIIGLSAEAGPEYEAGARRAGMDGALGKPCRPDQLRDALRQVNQGTFSSWKTNSKRSGMGT
jgi:CheY-like chemotaxis protein